MSKDVGCALCQDGWPIFGERHELPEPAGTFACSARLVIIESPYAGDIGANTEYARAAMRDSLERGEYPIASHLLYPQPGILDELKPKERQWGIEAGLAWREVAEKAVFYVDRGWSSGMLAARELYIKENKPFGVRSIYEPLTLPLQHIGNTP